ncbi:MAG: DUF481 domain-containing protein [Terriglobia bacterium]
MRKSGWSFVAIIVCGVFARAETVQFKNGDQLTGTWQRVVENQLLFKSQALGDLTLPVSKLKSFASSQKAVILVKKGLGYTGKLSLLESGEWLLTGDDGGTLRVAPADVIAIYPLEIYVSKGQEETFRPWHLWQGKASLGYSLVRGDSDAGTLSVGVNATRRQPGLPGLNERFRTNYVLNMLFANTRTNGLRARANSVTTSLRQDFLFSPTNFVFVLGQLDHIQTQSLDLRQTYGAGVGHDLLRRSRSSLQFLGGVTFVREAFQNADPRRNAEGLIGEKLSWKINRLVSFEHYFNFYPNLTDRGELRLDSASTVTTQISSRLSFNTTFADRYLSNPLPDHQKNELVLTTGFGLNF